MKLMKMFGLASLALVAAMAVVGVSSASASALKSVLCKEDEELCLAAHLWGEHVTLVASSEKVVFLGTLSITCKSHITVLFEKGDEHDILASITALLWSNCVGCKEVVATTLPTILLLTTINPLISTFDITGKLKLSFIDCTIFNLKCTGEMSSGSFALAGGTIGGTAKVSASEIPFTLSGGLCGTSGKYDAGSTGSSPYVVTSVNGSASGGIFASLKSHAL